MLKTHFKAAWRNLKKSRSTGIINISGLSIGMAAAVLIMLWVENELNYDNYHPNQDRIFYIAIGHKTDPKKFGGTPLLLAETAKAQIPEIEKITRLGNPSTVINVNNNYYAEKELACVDPSWFEIFHYDFVEGKATGFAQSPYSIIITKSLAKKYYGNSNALGQIIRIDSASYIVNGVVADNPSNSSFQYNLFIPIDSYLKTASNNAWTSWMAFSYQTFIRIKQGASVNAIDQKINTILLYQEQMRLASFSNGAKDTIVATIAPMRSLHFDNSFGGTIFKQGNKQVVLTFSVLGLLLLVIACINYVNLSTARASFRSKEVSIKKILGAKRQSLFVQFISESVLTTLISILITGTIVYCSLPWFSRFTEKNLDFSAASTTLWKILAGTLILAVMLTGIYPAVLLSSFKPLNVLRGFNILKMKNGLLRKILVTAQFTIAVALTISTAIILKQLNFIQHNAEGYNRSQIVYVSLPRKWSSDYGQVKKTDLINMLKNELGREPAIDRITVCSDAIQDIKMSMGGIADWTGKKPDAQPNITPLSVDVDFRKIFNLQMEEGRWFRSDNEEGKHGYILNQSAIAELGIEKPYIGQYFSILGDTGHIIGVVKDFHFRDYHQKISASVLLNNPDMRGTFFIQANGSKMKQAIAKTETVWKQFFPKTPFEYKFMDEEFAQMYRSESKTSQLLGLFSGIAIFISCLGLLGLVLFITEQRSREISIRKILGAGVTNIFSLVTREFVILVLIAFLIASPIAWMVMNRWLLDFAYRTDFRWWIFALAGFGVLVIALLTMSIQAIKASVANPASSLRNE